jgi:hypothetical protein
MSVRASGGQQAGQLEGERAAVERSRGGALKVGARAGDASERRCSRSPSRTPTGSDPMTVGPGESRGLTFC